MMAQIESSPPEARGRRSEQHLRVTYNWPLQADKTSPCTLLHLPAKLINHLICHSSQLITMLGNSLCVPDCINATADIIPTGSPTLELGPNTAALRTGPMCDPGTTNFPVPVRDGNDSRESNEGASHPDTPAATLEVVPLTEETERPKEPTGECLFFELPAELRNEIYRYALVSTDRIHITTTMIQPPPEPGILYANRQARQEALAIYYHENHFRFDMYDLNASAYMRWVRAEPVMRGRLSVWFKLYIPTSADLAWQNLMIWLEAIHSRRVAHGPSSRRFPGKRAFRIVVGEMKEMVEVLKQQGLGWAQILKCLESSKRMLIASSSNGEWI